MGLKKRVSMQTVCAGAVVVAYAFLRHYFKVSENVRTGIGSVDGNFGFIPSQVVHEVFLKKLSLQRVQLFQRFEALLLHLVWCLLKFHSLRATYSCQGSVTQDSV